jgi:uncharacterized membrane protein (UPF0127 family)
MRPMPESGKVVQESTGACLVSDCRVAASFLGRLRGWMFQDPVGPDSGLLLIPCNDIHMGFMRFPIDAVFLRRLPDQPETTKNAKNGDRLLFEVTSVREGLLPWKLIPVRDGKAHATLELPAGAVKRISIRPGDRLRLEPS